MLLIIVSETKYPTHLNDVAIFIAQPKIPPCPPNVYPGAKPSKFP